MEQKQLDEISFDGEEFIDDSDFPEIKVESAKAKKQIKPIKKKAEEKKVEVKKVEAKTKAREESKKVEPKPDFKKPEVKVEPIREPINPWAEEKKDDGLFSQAGTWKMVTGIVFVLLILSVLTTGFRFSGTQVSAAQAESKALAFVNNNLLPPPFVAQVEKTETLQSLYKVTLSVSGRTIDSYITKDGKLFFPQGFDMGKSLEEQLSPNMSQASASSVKSSSTAGKADATVAVETAKSSPSNIEEVVLIIPITAKKWVFLPSKIKAKQGQTVRLVIVPQGIEFTFSIPKLNIARQVIGQTEIEFVAGAPGTYEFLCSSCEDWRGMKGTLTIE